MSCAKQQHSEQLQPQHQRIFWLLKNTKHQQRRIKVSTYNVFLELPVHTAVVREARHHEYNWQSTQNKVLEAVRHLGYCGANTKCFVKIPILSLTKVYSCHDDSLTLNQQLLTISRSGNLTTDRAYYTISPAKVTGSGLLSVGRGFYPVWYEPGSFWSVRICWIVSC